MRQVREKVLTYGLFMNRLKRQISDVYSPFAISQSLPPYVIREKRTGKDFLIKMKTWAYQSRTTLPLIINNMYFYQVALPFTKRGEG